MGKFLVKGMEGGNSSIGRKFSTTGHGKESFALFSFSGVGTGEKQKRAVKQMVLLNGKFSHI
jgi:hypothetical protein